MSAERAATGEGKVLNFRALASAATALFSRMRMGGGRDGKSFDGSRDMYVSLGYKRDLFPEDYRDRYERNGVAQQIVEAYPSACWRGGGSIFEDPDPDTLTPFEEAWDALEKRLHLWSMFKQLDIVAGIGHYGVLLLGAPGDMSTPLTKIKPDDLMYVQPYTEADAPVQTYDVDYTSPRFGLPLYYGLRSILPTSLINPAPEGTGSGTALSGRPVHYTRIIHVADGLLDNRVFGKPRLKKVWNYLDDLMKISGGGSEAFWKRADGGLQLDLDPDIQLDAAGILLLEEQVEKYTHNLERVLRTRGVTMNRLGSDVADLKGPIGALMELISASTGIPQRILMGSERGELASITDQSNWDTRVSDRRMDFCYNGLVRPVVDRLIEIGALPKPKDEYRAEWPEVDELSEKDKVEVASKLASMPQEKGPIVTSDEIRTHYLGLEPLTPEQLKEIEAQEQKNQEKAEAQMRMQQEAGAQQQKAAVDQLPVLGEEPRAAAERTTWSRDGDGKFGSGAGDPNKADDAPAPGPGWVKLMKGGWVPPSHPDASKGIGRSPGVYDPKHVVKAPASRKPLRSNLERLHAAMGEDERAALRKGYDAAKDEGFAGDESDFMQEQLELYGKSGGKSGDNPKLKTWFSGATMTKFEAERKAAGHAEKMAKHKAAKGRGDGKGEEVKPSSTREKVESQPRLNDVVAVLAVMSDEEKSALHEGYEVARESGFAGNEQAFLMEQLDLYTTTEEDDERILTWFSAASMNAFTALKAETVDPKAKTDIMRSLERAVANGRRVLGDASLRSAMRSGDRAALERLIARSASVVERTLRA